MTYRVIFDLVAAGYTDWKFATPGLAGVAIGVALITFRRSLPSWWRQRPRTSSVFAFGFFIFALLWTVTALVSTHHQYQVLSTATRTHRAGVVEGRVSSFLPMPASGNALESFCVAQTCFAYSDYVITGGFNNTSTLGGPIRAGLQVRIHYVGNTMTKLEVAE